MTLFTSVHHHFGIRLSRRVDDRLIIIFNARNELDRQRFVDDLKESVAEMDEMEQLRITKSNSMLQLNNHFAVDKFKLNLNSSISGTSIANNSDSIQMKSSLTNSQSTTFNQTTNLNSTASSTSSTSSSSSSSSSSNSNCNINSIVILIHYDYYCGIWLLFIECIHLVYLLIITLTLFVHRHSESVH